MNKWILAAVAVGAIGIGYGLSGIRDLSGSEDIAVGACEALIRGSIRTPSSYRRIDASVQGNSVLVEYDAQNLFGAVLRSRKRCDFHFYDDRFHIQYGSATPDISEVTEVKKFLEGKRGLSPKKTALKPSATDLAVDACVESVMRSGKYKGRRPLRESVTIKPFHEDSSYPRLLQMKHDRAVDNTDFPKITHCTLVAKHKALLEGIYQ